MEKINAIITGVGGYVPDYILNNEELSRMVDTSDEWIMARVGIKERHILTEEGLGTSYMARKAAKQLISKTGVDPDSIDALIVTTTTPDYKFPSTASIVVGKLGLKNAFAFDLEAACCGFLYTLDLAASMIQSGRYKKIIVIGADKMYALFNGIPQRLITDTPWFYIALTTMLIGTQLFLAGFLGDLISRSSQNRNDYQIEKIIK